MTFLSWVSISTAKKEPHKPICYPAKHHHHSSCRQLEIVEGNCEGILSLYYVQQKMKNKKYYNTLPLRPLHLQTLVLKAFWETTPSPHCLLGLRPMTVKTPRTHKPPWVPQFLRLPQKRQKRRQYNPQGSLKAASTKWPLHLQKITPVIPQNFKAYMKSICGIEFWWLKVPFPRK